LITAEDRFSRIERVVVDRSRSVHVAGAGSQSGRVDRLGQDHLHGNVKRAVDAELGDTQPGIGLE
jgi:hypothetical protein